MVPLITETLLADGSTMIWTVVALEMLHAGSWITQPQMVAGPLIWTMMGSAATGVTTTQQMLSLQWAHTLGTCGVMAAGRM